MSSRTKQRKTTSRGLCLRIRVVGVAGDALGPGKAQLLEEVAKTGSLREAAFRLEMSYMKAWRLAEAMNDNFRAPLLKKCRGGSKRGGTQLTELGRKALMTYQRMTSRAGQAAQRDWKELSALLK
ncbi:MAG: LysR family transcriptional regulator [Terrimicrobiaceae bacterium]